MPWNFHIFFESVIRCNERDISDSFRGTDALYNRYTDLFDICIAGVFEFNGVVQEIPSEG